MFIKKLEVQGFKSFADRTKILFHPGITAIVGPNGTGKSNIVDAILWGLGGMRPKSVRGDRTGILSLTAIPRDHRSAWLMSS